MEHKQYVVSDDEVKAMSRWGSKKWREVTTSNEKGTLDRIVRDYEKFKVNLHGFIVYASRQNAEHYNIQPLKNLWNILQSKGLLVGVRKNLLKDYLIDNCGVMLDSKDDTKIVPNKEAKVDWKAIAEQPWWETVKASDDLSKYQLEAMVARFDTLIKFSQGDKVDTKAKDGLKYHILKKLGVVEHKEETTAIEKTYTPKLKQVG